MPIEKSDLLKLKKELKLHFTYDLAIIVKRIEKIEKKLKINKK